MKFLLLLTLLATSYIGYSQSIQSLDSILPKREYENICVHKMDGDDLTTQFVIWVKDTVASHKHEKHSEAVYILEGEGRFYFDDSVTIVREGDFIFIPKNTWHSVKVTSKIPMKVISNQSPAFYGEDRILKE